MLELLHYDFMRNALLAGLLASLACGMIGSLVVVNRIGFLSGGIAHAAYGGIGLAFFLGWAVLPTTLGFALCVAAAMAWVTQGRRARADTVVGVLWAVGMAIGIILVDLSPGYQVDLLSYLFGSILAVPESDLWAMLGMNAVILGVILVFYKEFLAMSYDVEFARARGVPVRSLYYVLLGLIAVSVVMLMRVVGLILVIALLTIPPYLAERYVRSLAAMMLLAAAFSALFAVCGLWLSYAFNLTSGASIIAVGAAAFLAVSALEGLRPHRPEPN
jgi:zinc transport system permease protein